ncbi:MAG: carboxypeptidase-like regulatory domain-containing protein [Acidobacteriota bacterium]
MFLRSALVILLLPGLAWSQTLAGRVLEDHTGAPLASANVKVSRPGDRFLAADLETDRDGRFQAAGLPAGAYSLEISKPNFAGTKLTATLSSAGANLTARLIKRGVIAGHVRDLQGQPIAGAVVMVMPKSRGSEALRSFGRTSTASTNVDTRGEYRIHNLPPGEYVAVVSYGASTRAMGSSGRASTPPNLGSGFLFYPSNSKPDTLSVTGGEEYRNIDFTIVTGAAYTVSGKVELPAPNSWFILGMMRTDQPGLAVAVAESAADGTFKFTGLPAASYRLVAATTARARNGQGFLLAETPVFGFTRVDIAGQNVEGIVVTPDAARTVIFNLRNAPGCPAAAQVELTPLEDWGSNLYRAVNVAAGKAASTSGLAPARYALTASGAGPVCYLESEAILDLAEGAPSAPVDLVFAPAATIRGKLNTGTKPTGAFAVALISSQDATAVEFATLDAQARFSFTGLKPGRYRMGPVPAGQKVPDIGKMFEFEVRGGSNAEIELAVAAEEAR